MSEDEYIPDSADEDDAEEEEQVAPAPAKRARKRPASQGPPAEPVNDDEEEQVAPAPAKRPRKRPARKGPPAEPVDDEDQEQVAPAPAKRARKRPARKAPPAEPVDDDDDDEEDEQGAPNAPDKLVCECPPAEPLPPFSHGGTLLSQNVWTVENIHRRGPPDVDPSIDSLLVPAVTLSYRRPTLVFSLVGDQGVQEPAAPPQMQGHVQLLQNGGQNDEEAQAQAMEDNGELIAAAPKKGKPATTWYTSRNAPTVATAPKRVKKAATALKKTGAAPKKATRQTRSRLPAAAAEDLIDPELIAAEDDLSEGVNQTLLDSSHEEANAQPINQPISAEDEEHFSDPIQNDLLRVAHDDIPVMQDAAAPSEAYAGNAADHNNRSGGDTLGDGSTAHDGTELSADSLIDQEVDMWDERDGAADRAGEQAARVMAPDHWPSRD